MCFSRDQMVISFQVILTLVAAAALIAYVSPLQDLLASAFAAQPQGGGANPPHGGGDNKPPVNNCKPYCNPNPPPHLHKP